MALLKNSILRTALTKDLQTFREYILSQQWSGSERCEGQQSSDLRRHSVYPHMTDLKIELEGNSRPEEDTSAPNEQQQQQAARIDSEAASTSALQHEVRSFVI